MSCRANAAPSDRRSDSPIRNKPCREPPRESRQHSQHPAPAAAEARPASPSTSLPALHIRNWLYKSAVSFRKQTASPEKTSPPHHLEPTSRRKRKFLRSFPSGTSTPASPPKLHLRALHQPDQSA